MNKKFKNSIVSLAIIAAFAVVFSSCNRGMGCPNNFSLEQGMSSVVGTSSVSVID